MSDVTLILSKLEAGDLSAAEELLPLVYEELRKLAAARMAAERSDLTLQATALVHEAYLRLVGSETGQNWNSRGHFFGAAAEAMRRILVEAARHRLALRNGGGRERVDLPVSELMAPDFDPHLNHNLLALDEVLEKLEQVDPTACQLVKLRYFTGLTVAEAAAVLGVSPRQADLLWAYARAWLRREFDA